MTFIAELEGAFAWIGRKGVYRQVPLFHRGDALFAKWGSGFVRLRAYGATSSPSILWYELDGGDLHQIDVPANRDPLCTLFNTKTLAKVTTKTAPKKIAAE